MRKTATSPILQTGRGWPSRTGASSSSAPTAASSPSKPRRSSTPRAAFARSPGGPWRSRPASSRLSSRSSTAASATVSPMISLSSRSASMPAGSRGCSAARPGRRRLAEPGSPGTELERRIELDLSVAGLSPPLHLPLAAGLAQGPGLPQPELPRSAERPHPAPLRRADGSRIALLSQRRELVRDA